MIAGKRVDVENAEMELRLWLESESVISEKGSLRATRATQAPIVFRI
jgi:hypothetical protein